MQNGLLQEVPWQLLRVQVLPSSCCLRMLRVQFFEEKSEDPGHPLANHLQTAKNFHCYNDWDKIFDETTTRPSIGLRVPFSEAIKSVR